MEVVLWISGLIVAYFVITFGLHMFRMKSDPYYRYKAQEAELEHQFNQKVASLRESNNPKVRELTDMLVGKDKGTTAPTLGMTAHVRQ